MILNMSSQALRLPVTMARRIAIIGGGSSGLACIKCCLDEGLEPVCFESSDDIGGLWRFKENPEPDRASIYRSVIINTSKEMMCFSDFPIPAHFPNYMHNSLIMDYFCMYAEHFQLLPHIRFQTRVKSVKQRPDFSRSGQWDVVTVNKDGRERSSIFDGCSSLCVPSALPRLFSQHPTVNDELPNRILSGTVAVKPNVREFRGSSVVFEDGTVEQDVYAVVFATGYRISFPFLPSFVVSVSDNRVSLYKYVFPPALERPTLAIIGLVQPLGAIMPISEMQARWATRVFKGLNKLPPADTMQKDIERKSEKMAKRYVASQRHTIQVDYMSYMDEVAGQIGARPSLMGLLLRDPRLGLSVLLGPCTPYQAFEAEMACRVAVIGAGCSGLACIKCCLDEGLEPVCFESSDDIGGLWRFKEKPEAGQANIYRSVIVNTSKEIMSYSDFPVPAQFPNYMHNSRLLEYFHLYAEHFQLRPHIRFQPNVREFRGSSLVFEDGTVETEIDSVIFATGYSYEFPFLPASLVSHQRGLRPALYKHVFPPRLEHPTLAVVGCLNTTEAIIPLSEMQARWATRVFAGLVKLPPEKTMLEDIEKTVREMEQKYTCSERGPFQVDYIPYLDSLAAQIGARPSLMGLLLRDPRLGLSVLLGPCTPYQYRLSGPGQWAGARSSILTQWERVEEPLRTRRAPHRPRGPGLALALKVSAAALLLSAAVVYIRGDPPALLRDPPALLRRLSVLPGAWTL
nr:PREDICTED: dimethylaniline monooxygenase [N-oxide-forming] 5-like [Lepisosteus oculatus]